ncbi:hypothetical protein BU24DRAFT_423232 [Aaosphaeria arxii CBS 175.79]|uniref:Heterokaryon incompatibility domain-containing protein n=1 Tax=Aaosphaeria arxii CBS 175.79 TaxID=1450172 RepID=A0A6A5XMV6_9PLEO|nr:uncharacterized protein BU24DRAFT_423232 [Aaosphaeria arxii CBS 175.79]KAF2014209.1 hypothetical protein BU24DRAFT_423232 [Aaosphaeria arxii CBS 175.79]
MSQGQNFCPVYRSHIKATYSRAAQRHLTTLPQSEDSAHSRCTEHGCRGHIKKGNNKPKHCSDCEGCGLVGPSLTDIKDCIRSGSIPLLRFRTSGKGKFGIEVVKATFEARYVAVSHVWTGGLGNPNANGLYECQLRKVAASGTQIRRIIEAGRMPSFRNMFRRIHRQLVLGDIDLFWVDTLCIPVREMSGEDETAASREMRGMAIDRMTHIYAGAHSVLVIDPEMRHLENDMLRTDPNQLYGRFIRSDWMRRCWTYQEGAMAGRLFALLNDEPIYLTRLRYLIFQGNPEQASALRQELTKWISDLPGPRQTQEYASRRFIIGRDQETFAEVWTALMSRTTSQEADLYLIFALMMDLVVGPLVTIRHEADRSRQLRTIFNSLEIVPLDFIYSTDVCSEACWLPKKMSTQEFSGNYLRRHSHEESTLVLTAGAAMAGLVSPGLYLVDTRALKRNELVIETVTGQRSVHLRFSHSVLARLPKCSPLVLMIKDTDASDDGLESSAAIFERISDMDAESKWQLKRLCAISCTLERTPNLSRGVSSHENLFVTLPEQAFEIQCDFGDALRLKPHRDPLMGGNPGIEVVVPMYMHRDSHIMLFFSLYLLLTGLIGCIPSAISFSPVWLLLIVYVALIPMIIDLFETQDRSKRLGNDIMHAQWIDALTPDLRGSALPRSVKLLKRINHGPIWTCSQLAIGLLFIVLGIKYYSNRDRRVMIVLGIMWILELGVRWALELTYNYVWRVGKRHPLVQEFLQDSRLTKWCKRWFGWPKGESGTGRQGWYVY